MGILNESFIFQTVFSWPFVLSLICGLCAVLLWRKLTNPLRKLPISRHSLLWGHFMLFKENPDIFVLLEGWYNEFKKEGVYRIDTKLDEERVIIVDPEMARQVLVTNASKYHRPDTLKEVFPNSGEELFMSNGAAHAYQKKLLNPMFSYGTVLGFLPIFQRHAEALVMQWKEKLQSSKDHTIEACVCDDLNHVALDIIGQSAFGYEFHSVSGAKCETKEAFETVLTQQMTFRMRILRKIIPFFDYLPLPGSIKLKKAKIYIESLLTQLISTNKASMKKDSIDSKESDSNERSPSLLKLLLLVQDEGTGARMPDSRIRANVFSFLLAGHETTATSLMWTLYLLAQHQEIQQQGHEESKTVIGEDEASITNEIVGQLDYVSCIIKESMRLYPAGPLIGRKVHQEDYLGSYFIPKGTVVMIDIIDIQRSEDFWEDAKTFKPERFQGNDADEYKKTSTFRYFPFTAGPRSCIGRRFALMEMKVVLALLLKYFHFDIDPNHPPIERRQLITMKAAPSPRLKISMRN